MDTARTRPGNSEPASASRRRLGDRLLLHAPVLAADQIAARMTRIRLDLADLATLDWIPGQQVRVVVGDAPAPKDWILGQMRTYSIWQCTPDWLDLAVLGHGDGPGAEWARHARPGQLAAFTRPQGTLVARPSGSHLLIGEETAAGLNHAARQLGIRNATLTSQVRQIETNVGTALLRSGPDGRLTLTAYGQLFPPRRPPRSGITRAVPKEQERQSPNVTLDFEHLAASRSHRCWYQR